MIGVPLGGVLRLRAAAGVRIVGRAAATLLPITRLRIISGVAIHIGRSAGVLVVILAVVAGTLGAGIGVVAMVGVDVGAGARRRVVGVVATRGADIAGIGIVAVVVVAVVGLAAVVAVDILAARGPAAAVRIVVVVVGWAPSGRRREQGLGRYAEREAKHRVRRRVIGGVGRITVGRWRRIVGRAHPGRIVIAGTVDDHPIGRDGRTHVAGGIADLD